MYCVYCRHSFYITLQYIWYFHSVFCYFLLCFLFCFFFTVGLLITCRICQVDSRDKKHCIKPGLQSCDQFKPLLPDVSNLRPVAQLPAVRGLVLPAYVPWIFPEQRDLPRCVSCMPESIPQVLTRTGLRLHCLKTRQKTVRPEHDLEPFNYEREGVGGYRP